MDKRTKSKERPRSNSKDKKKQPLPQQKRKMRDVTEAKRQAYYNANKRIIDKKNARKEDLMLCVKENQMKIAQHIIVSQQLIDVIDIRGLEEYQKLTYTLDITGQDPYTQSKVEKTFNGQLWNPVSWAYFQSKMDYLTTFYEQMNINLSHSLDINPGKFDIDNNDENLYLNKGKM